MRPAPPRSWRHPTRRGSSAATTPWRRAGCRAPRSGHCARRSRRVHASGLTIPRPWPRPTWPRARQRRAVAAPRSAAEGLRRELAARRAAEEAARQPPGARRARSLALRAIGGGDRPRRRTSTPEESAPPWMRWRAERGWRASRPRSRRWRSGSSCRACWTAAPWMSWRLRPAVAVSGPTSWPRRCRPQPSHSPDGRRPRGVPCRPPAPKTQRLDASTTWHAAALDARRDALPDVAEAEEAAAAASAELARVERLAATIGATLGCCERPRSGSIVTWRRSWPRRSARWLPDRLARRATAEISVDPADLPVSVKEAATGQWRDARLLSEGTREQIYLLLRVAMAEHLVTTGGAGSAAARRGHRPVRRRPQARAARRAAPAQQRAADHPVHPRRRGPGLGRCGPARSRTTRSCGSQPLPGRRGASIAGCGHGARRAAGPGRHRLIRRVRRASAPPLRWRALTACPTIDCRPRNASLSSLRIRTTSSSGQRARLRAGWTRDRRSATCC